MGFWEALFVGALAVGVACFAYARHIAARPTGLVLLLGGVAVFATRLVQAGPYVHPSGFDLLAGLGGVVLGALLLARGRGDRGRPIAHDVRFALALAPLVLLGALIAVVHEVGEIVTLRTLDSAGSVRETRLAVLDYQGATWVGAGSGEERQWYQELAANPQVELVRGGAPSCRIAVPVREPGIRDEVARRLERKYLSGRVFAALGSHLFLNEEAIAIRLDPCPE